MVGVSVVVVVYSSSCGDVGQRVQGWVTRPWVRGRLGYGLLERSYSKWTHRYMSISCVPSKNITYGEDSGVLRLCMNFDEKTML
jgi:hypothetical protein